MIRSSYLFARNLKFLLCLVLLSVTLCMYWQTGSHEFISFDDEVYVTNNFMVQQGLTFESVSWAFSTFHAGNWHPVTWLSHMLDCTLYGLNPKGHHLTNVIFHMGNTVLLFILFTKLTGALWRGFLIAALFALHPLHVESVAWAAERKDVLSTFFFLITILSYCRYTERPHYTRYLLTLLAFAIGLMAKPMLVTLPFLLLLIDFWPLGRLQSGAQPGDGCKNHHTLLNTRKLIVAAKEKIPFFILSAASSLITYMAQQAGGAVVPLKAISLSLRLANALDSYLLYLWHMLWPRNLAILYPFTPAGSLLSTVGAAVMLGIVTVLALKAGRKYPYLPVGWLWYLITLLPVIGLIQVGAQAMADRYTYIPLVGIFLIIAWGIPELPAGRRFAKPVLATSAAILLFALSWCSWRQIGYWKNDITLFTHAVEVTDNNSLAHLILGTSFYTRGVNEAAFAHYYAASRDNGYAAPRAYHNLGQLFAERSEVAQAVRHYKMALQLNPDSADTYCNLGRLSTKMGRREEAIGYYRKALSLDPDNADAHNNLGVALDTEDNITEAMYHFTIAARLRPDSKQAQDNLARINTRSRISGEHQEHHDPGR